MSPSFCTGCGTALGSQDRFCGTCGRAATIAGQASSPRPTVHASAAAYPTGGAIAYQPQYAYAVPAPHAAGQRTNGFAIASLVLGIVWIYWIGSTLALIFGLVALSQIRSSQDRQTGSGMAIAGVVLGIVGLATLLLTIVLATTRSVYLFHLFLL
jgi:Domain of unknown function (DUF4190)